MGTSNILTVYPKFFFYIGGPFYVLEVEAY